MKRDRFAFESKNVDSVKIPCISHGPESLCILFLSQLKDKNQPDAAEYPVKS